MTLRPPRSTAVPRRPLAAPPDPVFDGLTDDEQAALELTGELYSLLCRIAGNAGTRAGDLSEVALHIHALQNLVLAQVAGRAYPGRFRLLGGSLR